MATGMTKPRITNCLSFDIEGFAESNLESFEIQPKYISNLTQDSEIETNTNFTIDYLARLEINATFFFLGRVARDIPQLVKRASEAGHEVACHGFEHSRLHNIGRKTFYDQLSDTKKRLEDIAGQRVYGFRAPDFSITESSVWVLDILKDLGFQYDSSIFPISMHDVYGIRRASPSIHEMPNGLIEYPLSTIQFFGGRFPFGGGGYFRLYPLFVTRTCISKMNRSGQACMFYMHPYELGPIIPKIPGLSFYRRFRHYHGCGAGAKRLENILRAFKFSPATEILKQRGLPLEK
jgi:polysaccharide deacetylase family protein (PEP-CTERM system associated)